MKGLRVTKIIKENQFEGAWCELDLKKGFQRQSFTKYLRLTLVFMQNSALREKFNFYVSVVFLSINKIFILQEDWALAYHSTRFRQFPDIS